MKAYIIHDESWFDWSMGKYLYTTQKFRNFELFMSFGVDLFQYSFHTTFSCSEILYFSSQVIHFLIRIKLKPDLNIHFPVADRFEKTFHLGEGKRI